MAKADVKFVVSKVGGGDHTGLLALPKALTKFGERVDTLPKFEDGTIMVSWEDNQWDKGKHVTPDEAVAMAKLRLTGTDKAGVDLFAKGKSGLLLKKSPTQRIRSVEKYKGATFNYSGEISPELRKLCEDIWAEFGDDPSLYNGGVHVCRKIAGSSSWSQHSWDDAIDLMIGSDMHLGDQINSWLNKNEGKYGGFCEQLWRVPSHFDHVHLSLSPCHSGTPPCA